MLMPKRVKYRRVHRGRMTGKATRGNFVAYGDYGLMATEPCWITSNQIEAARIAMTRYTKRGGKVWIKIFPDKPVTAKPAETRMGSGKGSPEYWVAVVKPGRVLFEIAGVSDEVAREAMRLASHKLPCKTKIVKKGEEFEGGKATDFVLFMGQGRMIPGFEEGIVGHKAGEQFDINVTFPAEYHSENLKGKDAKFAITLKKVEEMELPELTDEFVAKFGPNTKTVADLRAEIRKNMERELKNALVSRVKQQVINGLIEQNPIDVPASAVEEEINVLRNQAAQRFGGNAQHAAQLPRELFEADAKRRVQVGLLFSEVIKSNELKPDEERAKAMIADIASAYEQPAEVVEYYSKNEELMNNIRNVVLEEQAVDAVLAKAQVTEKASSFDEIMNPQA